MINIEKFCQKYNFGKVINISKLSGGLMHKMFKVETDKGIYCIKILNTEIMSRREAYNNFVISELVSNLAKKSGIPVSSALNIEGNYLTKLDDMYYMVFDFVKGNTLKDSEITVEHCKKIAKVLAQIHNLDYKEIGLEPNIVEYKKLHDWESYINHPNISKMSYKDIFLNNYKKYNSILERANESFNESNKNQTICHSDMDPKNVMWNIDDIEWYSVICGNLISRFNWLKYNLERSLGIITNDEEEIKLAENEAIKTINEINRYIELIDKIYDTINRLTNKKL